MITADIAVVVDVVIGIDVDVDVVGGDDVGDCVAVFTIGIIKTDI